MIDVSETGSRGGRRPCAAAHEAAFPVSTACLVEVKVTACEGDTGQSETGGEEAVGVGVAAAGVARSCTNCSHCGVAPGTEV